jgi:hypothetical protein
MTQTTETLATMRAKSASPIEAQLPAVAPGFGSLQSFELMQRAAKLLSISTLVPAHYRAFDEKKGRDNPSALANCVVALNMAQRMEADPLMIMQNLYVVEGRPSWSSQWIIAAINGCGRFSPLRFDLKDLGEKEVEYTVVKWENRERVSSKHKAKIRNLQCIAWAVEKETGEKITSPAVSIEMAVQEGWYSKAGSKWQTMPEVMLRYRTASFFGKLYAPELLMGLQTVEEVHDIIDVASDGNVSVTTESLRREPRDITPSSQIDAQEAPENVSAKEPEAAAEVPAPNPENAGQGEVKAQAPEPPPKKSMPRQSNKPARPANAAEIARAGGIEDDDWTPSDEEMDRIHAREMAEAEAEAENRDIRQGRPSRYDRGSLNLE